jgi:hypothetical protein
MSKSSKTQTILKDKTTQIKTEEAECSPCEAARRAREAELAKQQQSGQVCEPCKAKQEQENTIWKVSVNYTDVSPDTPDVASRFKLIGDALQQYSGFTASQVQSIFTSISLMPSDWNLIFSGNEYIATAIYNELARLGLQPKIQASLKTF